MVILLIAMSFLLAFAAIADILRTPPHAVRRLSPPSWLLVVMLIPYFGVLAWVVFGKPTDLADADSEAVMPPPQQRHRIVGPDDDPHFIAALNDQLRGNESDD